MYILYGVGAEAERFLFQNRDILDAIDCCIDRRNAGVFHNIPVLRLENVKNAGMKKIIVAAGEWDTYCDIKAILEKSGLKEFVDFVWSKFFRKKVVLVNANCHGDAIVRYLQQSNTFCNRYELYPLPPIHLNERKEIPQELLSRIDVYLHQDIQADNRIGYKLSDEYVLPRLKPGCRHIAIPNFVGMAGWMFPTLGGLDKVINAANGPLYVLYRDKALDVAVEAHCASLAEFRKFWCEYTLEEDELNEKWEQGFEKLKRRERNWDIKIVKYIMDNCRKIPCFVDASHPSKYVMREVGKQVASILGIHDIDDSAYESKLGKPTPILPAVRKHFNLDFKAPCEKQEELLGKRVTGGLDDYIIAYIWWYHGLSIS